MSREQLVNRAKDALLAAAEIHARDGGVYVQIASQAVIDAVLPQITTVEQATALPSYSVVVDRYGHPWTWETGAFLTDVDARSAERVLADSGPLTVVWQP